RCAHAAAGRGVGSLRDGDLDMVSGSTLAEIEQRAARHVICENQRVLRSAAALVTGDLELLGELMFDSHGSLRDLLDVSCPELDALVEIAAGLRGDGGVFGARMTGGGFGGCVVLVCRADAVHRVRDRLATGYAKQFGTTPLCFTVAPSGPACSLSP
ncbi:MAG: galactokinase, partial [Planctomycetes bacterium]|nr:galactokinase [Planctomycetota bacterium]